MTGWGPAGRAALAGLALVPAILALWGVSMTMLLTVSLVLLGAAFLFWREMRRMAERVPAAGPVPARGRLHDLLAASEDQRRELEEKTQALERTIGRLEEYKRLIEQQNQALKELAIRDGLTGIYNHRHFQELLDREVALAQRHDRELACLMMDLDHFKKVNDLHGHQFGDFVLKEFVRLVRREIRSSDIFARYGGEEFVLLLPSISREGARRAAEKIRTAVEAHAFRLHEHERRVTVTIGVYHGKPAPGLTDADILRCADRALYQAKARGRNRVFLHLPDPTIGLWEKTVA